MVEYRTMRTLKNMLRRFLQKRTIETAVFTTIFTSLLGHPQLGYRTYAQNQSNQNSAVQTILSNEDWNAVARVSEKVIRANGLDENTWRIVVVNKYHDNAFASDVNLVAIYSGLLEKIRGDDAALAFIIGHELAHHTKRHIAVGASSDEALKAKLEAEADAEIKELIAKEKEKYNSARDTSNSIGIFCGVTRVCKNKVVNIAALGILVLGNDGKPDTQKIDQKKREIITKKEQEYLAKSREIGHSQELEADEVGYTYMATAGYDPKGGFRVMNVLGRTAGAESENSTHPRVTDRVEALNNLIKQRPSQALSAKGTATLRSGKPLTFDISKDGMSLLINSRFSSGKSLEKQ